MAKSVLITGCSAGGIGHYLALSFQKRGLTVFATARELSRMTELQKLPNVHLLSLDVTSETSVAEAFAKVQAHTDGKLDFLVNNAGRGYHIPTLDADIKRGKEIFETNFWGALRMIQAFAPLLVQSKGTVVNIGSINAYLHQPYSGIYGATKAALHMLSEILRVELAPLGVKVVTVVTGSITTNIGVNAGHFSLPADSHYKKLEEKLSSRFSGNDGIVRSGAAEYAENVASDLLAGANGKIFRGKNASMTRYFSVLLPTWHVDKILSEGTGLDLLKQQ